MNTVIEVMRDGVAECWRDVEAANERLCREKTPEAADALCDALNVWWLGVETLHRQVSALLKTMPFAQTSDGKFGGAT